MLLVEYHLLYPGSQSCSGKTTRHVFAGSVWFMDSALRGDVACARTLQTSWTWKWGCQMTECAGVLLWRLSESDTQHIHPRGFRTPQRDISISWWNRSRGASIVSSLWWQELQVTMGTVTRCPDHSTGTWCPITTRKRMFQCISTTADVI